MKQMSTLLMVACAVTISANAFAQKDTKNDPKHTNFFQNPDDIELKELAIEMRDVIARMDNLKFRAKFTNATNDFLLIDPSKFTMSVDGKEFHPSEKAFILDPNDSKGKTIDFKGETNFHVDAFDLEVDGFARIPIDGGTPTSMPDFQLPASTNVISSGDFEINLKQLKKETQETWARFEIKYKGDGYGIVDPSRISAKTESGQQFANDDRKSKNILLEKGETKTVNAIFHIPAKVVDMQMGILMVNWGEAMVATKAVAIDADESVSFKLDEALTAEKNK